MGSALLIRFWWWPPQLPDSASLLEFQQTYAFLKARPVPGTTDEQERQRYMFGYSMFVLTRSAFLVALITAIIAFLCMALPQLSRPEIGGADVLSLWPPNALLESRILGHAAFDPSSQAVATSLVNILYCTTLTHAVWIVWLLGRILVERRRHEYIVDRPARTYLNVVVAAAVWAFILNAPINDESSYGPAFDDSPIGFAVKEAIYISGAYFITGSAILYATTQFRAARKPKLFSK